MTSVQKVIRDFFQQKPPEFLKQSEKELSHLFAEIFRPYVRYNATARSWFKFDGRIWQPDQEAMKVLNLAKDFSSELLHYASGINDESRRNSFTKFVLRFGDRNHRESLVRDARDCFSVTREDLDTRSDLLNCRNGVLDINTLKLLPHSPDHLLTKCTNCNYNPNVRSELWEKFVYDVMKGDQTMIRYLQKLCGYALTDETDIESCWILYGPTTRNGKSTFVESIKRMLGSYAITMQPESLAVKKDHDTRRASGDIARLDGCRFLTASEPPLNMLFDAALLKSLLGRDTITARHLQEREFEFVPKFKLFINTNHLPTINDDTLFSSGRICVIPFERHFSEKEQDTHLKQKFQTVENLTGILSWCVDGLRLYRSEGVDPPDRVKDAVRQYRYVSDKWSRFRDERLMVSTNNASGGNVFGAYQSWCRDNGYQCESKKDFFGALRERGLMKDSGTVNGKTEHNVVVGLEISGPDFDTMQNVQISRIE